MSDNNNELQARMENAAHHFCYQVDDVNRLAAFKRVDNKSGIGWIEINMVVVFFSDITRMTDSLKEYGLELLDWNVSINRGFGGVTLTAVVSQKLS